jgi:hypothetical protein
MMSCCGDISTVTTIISPNFEVLRLVSLKTSNLIAKLYILSAYTATTLSKDLIDKCFLVLIHTPLFMFVRPLALLISNHFTCFVCFVINRSLQHILTKGAKMDLKPSEEWSPAKVRSTALGAFEHTYSSTQGEWSNAWPSQLHITRIP